MHNTFQYQWATTNNVKKGKELIKWCWTSFKSLVIHLKPYVQPINLANAWQQNYTQCETCISTDLILRYKVMPRVFG